MDPTRGKEIAATFEEVDAAMTMDTSLMPGDDTGGDGGAAGNDTSSLPQPSVVGEETSLLAPFPESDFVSSTPYSPAPRLLHRRAHSDIIGLAGESEEDLFSTFAGAEGVNNPTFVNPSSLMARAAGLLPPRPRPRHQHSHSMDVSSSLQAHRLLGLPATASSSSLHRQRLLGLPATTTQASSSLQAQRLFALPATTTQASSSLEALRLLGLGLPATAASSSRQPQRLELGGFPAMAQASGSLPAQRLPELPATSPSSSRQAQRVQHGLPTTPSSSSRQSERLQLGSPATATAAGTSKAAIRKAMLAAEFEQIAIKNPERARRMLANRQSAARSKERKARYVVELEQKAQAIKTDVAALSTNVELWQTLPF
ncbi:hypothetical protein E2562_037968 [Oryza meyeriana var. granulata]|uniref:BZIP domain-containing protein n=1 Tax=Oryza meyeriana var. granulata TaxID=110450 RepID=A0A6G1CM00_9ORYZ|nr:hypothetical protein E2562_037968 [Oryza meyeriana var. granulata]